jgi:2-dehydro-3-deoxygalactonokinase
MVSDHSTHLYVDWGTTNRRAYVCQGNTVLETYVDDLGTRKVEYGQWENALIELRNKFSTPSPSLTILAGMVGSNIGWVEVPYVTCPAGLHNLAASLHWVIPGEIAIVPGLSVERDGTADVMRGEEVQVLGALSKLQQSGHHVLCTPGTHNKWVSVRDNRIERFSTVLTGEVFELLKKHSILAELLASDVTPDEPFCNGVRRSLHSADLMAELFRARARVLLGIAPRASIASYVSGLLIGEDVRIGREFTEQLDIYVVGDEAIAQLYRVAISISGRSAKKLDASEAFINGMLAIAELCR